MSEGIRATVEIPTPGNCPIARFSRVTETVIEQISTSITPPGPTSSATDFLVDIDRKVEGEWEPLFSYGSTTLYRVRHDEEVACPCLCLGEFGCPIQRYVAENGTVTLVFHAANFAQLQDVIGELQEHHATIDVQQLLQSPPDAAPSASVFVNRDRLTARQLEVLQTAYEMGYFERPRRSNATEIAAELDISQSTVTEHLSTAQRKILDDVLVNSSRKPT